MKMFDAGITRMIGLPYSEKNYDNMLRRFHLTPERHGRTDRQADRIAISISRVSALTRDKNFQNSLAEKTRPIVPTSRPVRQNLKSCKFHTVLPENRLEERPRDASYH